MRPVYKPFFILFLFCNIIFSQQNFNELKTTGFKKESIVTKNDTINIISTNVKTNIAKPTILFIQGSKAIPIVLKDSNDVFVNIPFDYKKYSDKYNFVMISRKGIPVLGNFQKHANGYLNEFGETPLNYKKYDNLSYRTFQSETVINYLYKQKWVQKDSIYVIGHSEGYRVTAKLATKTNKISKIICMSADPFNRTAEMVFRERINCFNNENDSVSQSKIESLIENFKKIGSNIKKYKDNYDLYNWMSYEKDMPYKNFKKIKKPILIIYGTNDIPATHNDLIPYLLKQNNILLKAFSDYDHNYFKKEFDKNGNAIEDSYHWDDVMNYCIKWLSIKE